MDPRALGIDIGTTNVKVAIVEGGDPPRIVGSASAGHPTFRPRPGWAEQSPDAWWGALVVCLRRLSSDLGSVGAVAVSGQGSTFALCDEQGRPLGRAVGWQDLRGALLARQIDAELRPLLDRAHGNAIGDAPEPKLLWLREHEAAVIRRARVVLTASAVVGARLGADMVLNEGDAGSWVCWDRHRRRWSAEIAGRLDLETLLPPVASLGQPMGEVSSRVARDTGIPPRTPLVASSTDLGSAAIGAGVGRPGEASYSKGTGGFLCCCVRAVDHPSSLLALPIGTGDLVQLCAAIDTLGAAYDWCRAVLGGLEQDEAEALARAAPPGSRGLLVLPWLQGAQHPILDPDARGVMLGLSLETTPGDLLRAVLEGTSLALRQHLQVARRVTAERFDVIVSSGGPVRNELWNRLDAAATETPIAVAPQADAAVGAALIAGEGAGLWPDAVALGRALRDDGPVYEPEPELVAAAREGDKLSRELAGRVAPMFASLRGIRSSGSDPGVPEG